MLPNGSNEGAFGFNFGEGWNSLASADKGDVVASNLVSMSLMLNAVGLRAWLVALWTDWVGGVFACSSRGFTLKRESDGT
jgi:hypothetical protein